MTIENFVHADYTETRTGELVESFGVVDGKGRELGALAVLGTMSIKQVAPRDMGCGAREADLGDWFIFYPAALRGGHGFGASHGFRKFRTEAERNNAAAKYLADARKRALKNKAVKV